MKNNIKNALNCIHFNYFIYLINIFLIQNRFLIFFNATFLRPKLASTSKLTTKLKTSTNAKKKNGA